MEVASEHSHYWKTTNLDEFNGTGWVRATAPGSEPALGEPLKFHPKGAVPRPPVDWIDRINFTDRGLSSDFAVGAGTVLAISRIQARPAPDAIWSMTNELRPGDSYTALVYDPKPSPAEMRAAGTAFPAAARHYVSFDLPGRSVIEPPFWGPSGPASIAEQVRGTPYVGMYELARRLAAGARTPYEAAQRIELYLRDTYAYRQNVPQHEYPLPAFLSQDRAGYCQQFSGTMALMLRMLGIPSRVSTGFAPGGRDPERNNFLVDDTDAHDWVEVFFPAIGWVTFEPTPAAAPAATQLDDNDLGVTKSPTSDQRSSGPPLPQNTGGDAPKPKPTASGVGPQSSGGSGLGLPIILAGVAGAAALGALAVYGHRHLAQRPAGPRPARRGGAGGAGFRAGADRLATASGHHAASRPGPAGRLRRCGRRRLCLRPVGAALSRSGRPASRGPRATGPAPGTPASRRAALRPACAHGPAARGAG